MTGMSDLDAQEREGVIGIYFAPATAPRAGAAIIVDHLAGPKRYAWYWLHLQHAPQPDWKHALPDDAICLWKDQTGPA